MSDDEEVVPDVAVAGEEKEDKEELEDATDLSNRWEKNYIRVVCSCCMHVRVCCLPATLVVVVVVGYTTTHPCLTDNARARVSSVPLEFFLLLAVVVAMDVSWDDYIDDKDHAVGLLVGMLLPNN